MHFKSKIIKEVNEIVTNCDTFKLKKESQLHNIFVQLKMKAQDGKLRSTALDIFDLLSQFLRLSQSRS